MNDIPKDAYADSLLLNIKILKSGAVITRDAYADGLLNYVHDEATTHELPVNEKLPDHDVAEKGEEKG